MISAEALFNGSRWRLQVTPGGTFTVHKRGESGWDHHYSGNGGIEGVREAADTIRSLNGYESEACVVHAFRIDAASSRSACARLLTTHPPLPRAP